MTAEGAPARTLPASDEILERLIGFDTVSRNSNRALIDFIADLLDDHGVKAEIQLSDDGRKANLFATIGPEDVGGIILSGHTDVVPVDEQPWTVDPFRLSRKDGRLYGRGTADMKGFIAVVLACVPYFTQRRLKTPIHLAFSYDEEVGCLGVRPLIAALRERPVRPRGCIIGEPTEMRLVTGHKGKLAVRCDVRGLACHSAHAPDGVNAVEYAAELIHRIRAIARREESGGERSADFDPPFATIQCGVVSGGTAVNIVPDRARFDFEARVLPGQSAEALVDEVKRFAAEELVPDMRRRWQGADILFSELSSYPGLACPADTPLVAFVRELTGANKTGTVSFGTEGGLYDEAGIPTVVCGPGSMAQGHKPDEYVTLDQLRRCEDMLRRLADRLEEVGL
ncbi:acetylornithine deacetylase [Rhodospirillaceae bacterium SYSU D60014]|uniref:acetylornithine deacetylase n=1 Tax=Virgifigura deserti TaxID=2268457 RepID=UPI000E662840